MKKHFLVVDDDEMVRSATARMVEHVTGCAVESCGSGDEALRIVGDEPGAFACIVTDFEMPGMNGLELCARLRALAPEARVLLVTGSPGALGGTEGPGRGFDCFLAKPFDLVAMEAALRRILPLPDNSPASPPHGPGAGGASLFESPRGISRAAI